ncbi:MAG: hypothetical protein U0821_25815 [Chloroflexota bacterium]
MAGFAGFQRNGAYGWWLNVIILISAFSVALVAPTNGLCDPEAHEVAVVHPIFQHQHDPHAAHRLTLAPEQLIEQITTGVTAAITMASPRHAGLALAIQGMTLVATTVALAALALWGVPPLSSPRPAPVWAVVPTGPPRRIHLGR